MALSRTNKLQANSGVAHGTGAFTTSSFTPSNNTLLLVLVYAGSENNDALAGSDLTCSGGGLTWTPRATTTTHPGWGYAVRAFTAPVSTGASMTVQVDAGTFNVHRYRVEVFEYSGYDTSTPTGATAIGSDADGDVNATITLSGAPSTNSEVIGAVVVSLTSNVGGITPGASAPAWTELFEFSETDWQVFQSQARSGSASTSVTWDDLNSNGGGQSAGATMLAVEIKAATSGSSITGTGALTNPAATASGTGLSAKTGTGAITSSVATVSGTGSRKVTGTGAVSLPKIPVVSSTTGSAVTGSGGGTAGPSTLSGSGAHGVQDTPGAIALVAGTMGSVSGTAHLGVTITGIGAITSSVATVAGSATHNRTGTGAITSSRATASGSAFIGRSISGSGALTAGACLVAGVSVKGHTGTGALTSSRAVLSGFSAGAGGGISDPGSSMIPTHRRAILFAHGRARTWPR